MTLEAIPKSDGSGPRPESTPLEHLETALEATDDPETHYHIREAMQLLEASEDRERLG
jgi:hypothetical protein